MKQYTKFKYIYVIALVLSLSFLKANEVEAQACAYWDQNTGQIYSAPPPAGQHIGAVNIEANQAQDFNGRPLSQQGITCLTGSIDGRSYDPDDVFQEDDDDDDFDPCTIPGNPFCGGNPGGGGGGGGGGGTGGGGGGGSGSGSSPRQVAQAASVAKNPKAEGSGSGRAKSITALGMDETAKGVIDGNRVATVALLDTMPPDALIMRDTLKRDPNTFLAAIDGNAQGGGAQGRTKVGATGEASRPGLGELYGYQNWKDLPRGNVGIDDEVLKTSMAMYQPKFRLDLDYLNDKNARDRYYDQAKTLRGVSVLAMSFLDNSLGAGLHDIQVQADQNTQAEFLKQINWSLERLASPDRSQAFVDTDEKLEACLEVSLRNQSAKKEIEGITRKRVEFECSDFCGEPPQSRNRYENDNKRDWSQQGNGSYAYCVCCASTDSETNKLGEEQRNPIAKNNVTERSWSLVERAVYGVMGEQEKGEHKQVVDEFVESYIQLFGDVVMRQKTKNGGLPYLAFQQQMPQVDTNRFISLHYNKCHHSEEPNPDTHEVKNCGIEREDKFNIKYGICPSLKVILQQISRLHASATVIEDQATRLVESSMGIPITAGLVRSIIYMLKADGSSIAQGEERGRAYNSIHAFCEASAIAGVVRQLKHFRNATLDILTMNQHLSQKDKSRMLALLDRYLEQLRMIDTHSAAKAKASAVSTGISLIYSRALAGQLASDATGAIAQANRSSIASNIAGFGGTLTGTSGAGGGGGAQARGADVKLSPQYESNIASMMNRIESSRSSNMDPIDNGVPRRFSAALTR